MLLNHPNLLPHYIHSCFRYSSNAIKLCIQVTQLSVVNIVENNNTMTFVHILISSALAPESACCVSRNPRHFINIWGPAYYTFLYLSVLHNYKTSIYNQFYSYSQVHMLPFSGGSYLLHFSVIRSHHSNHEVCKEPLKLYMTYL